MRVDQVDIGRDATARRNRSQRLPVTEFRQDGSMPRPLDLPKFDTIGERVRYWRVKRKISRKELAKRTKQSYTALASLENKESHGSERLDLIAIELKLNPVYLRTDRWSDPEAQSPITEDSPSEWLSQLRELDLDEIEDAYFATEAKKALQTIENARNRKHKKSA